MLRSDPGRRFEQSPATGHEITIVSDWGLYGQREQHPTVCVEDGSDEVGDGPDAGIVLFSRREAAEYLPRWRPSRVILPPRPEPARSSPPMRTRASGRG